MGDYVTIWIRPEQFPSETNKKLHTRNAGPFKVLQWVDPNMHVLDFDINSTFNIENLVAY
jgi:hypothetical protein